MIATVTGNYVNRRQGTSEGKDWDYTIILTGDEVINVYGYDPGPAVKRLDPVTVQVEQRKGKEGRLYYSFYKG